MHVYLITGLPSAASGRRRIREAGLGRRERTQQRPKAGRRHAADGLAVAGGGTATARHAPARSSAAGTCHARAMPQGAPCVPRTKRARSRATSPPGRGEKRGRRGSRAGTPPSTAFPHAVPGHGRGNGSEGIRNFEPRVWSRERPSKWTERPHVSKDTAALQSGPPQGGCGRRLRAADSRRFISTVGPVFSFQF